MKLTLGRLIRLKRAQKEYTMRALADEIGVSRQAIVFWEKGNDIRFQQFIKLAKALDFSTEDILNLIKE